MAINNISNNEGGLSIRQKLNAIIQLVNEWMTGKVDAVPGKALSSNDYTNEEKTKVANALTSVDISNLTTKVANAETAINGISTALTNYINNGAERIYDVINQLSISVVHDIDCDYPNVTFVDESGYIVTVSVQYAPEKQINVSWNEAKSGKIIIKR